MGFRVYGDSAESYQPPNCRLRVVHSSCTLSTNPEPHMHASALTSRVMLRRRSGTPSTKRKDLLSKHNKELVGNLELHVWVAVDFA